MIKKLIAIILAILLLFLAGCGSEGGSKPDGTGNTGTDDIRAELQLLYCATDTINPYKTINKLNAELGLLLFDPLFMVNNDFEAVAVLAKEISTEGKIHTVTLKDAKFSDGSTITAEDVLFSYNLAKESQRFSYLFYEIETVTAADGKTIVFTLNQHDPYFAKLLTFPILKNGSDQLEDDDSVELPPIGSGKFIFDEEKKSLIPNKNYFGNASKIEKINLVNAPDNESMEHYVEIGATDIYYATMGDNTIIRMSGKKKQLNLNNLIYLGVNHYYGPLRSAELRYAISSALSRTHIAEKAFHSNATPTTGFFHPSWNETADYQTIQISSNLKISVENLKKIGYNKLNADGYYENSAGNVLELSLLVNNESTLKVVAAELIATQLKASGIKINISAVPENEYFRSLESRQFQLYLGEVKLLPNMDVAPLVISGGSAAYGMPHIDDFVQDEAGDAENGDDESQDSPSKYNNQTAYIPVVKGYSNGENTAADVASALLSSMPIIPLVYKNSIIFYSTDIEEVGSASSYDIFLAIDEFKIKK